MSGSMPKFFRTAQSKSFEPRYRYYNERKERLESLIVKHKDPESKEAYRARLRSEFARHRRVKGDRNANLRVVAIAALLFLIVAYLYF